MNWHNSYIAYNNNNQYYYNYYIIITLQDWDVRVLHLNIKRPDALR